MKYNGIELKDFTSDKPVVFDPPKRMLCWDNNFDVPQEQEVVAYLPMMPAPVFTAFDRFAHCAELPEELEPRRATYLELAKWLAQGNGIYTGIRGTTGWTSLGFDTSKPDYPCNPEWRVRKWDDADWHEPTADYMGL